MPSQLFTAIGKSMLGRYCVYAFNLLSMMVLARIFTPEVFGIIAAVTVFFTFFQVLAEAGLAPAIINLDSLVPVDRNGIFSVTIVVGMVLAIVFAYAGPILSIFYGLPRLDEVSFYIAASLVFFAAVIVPNALLLREQAFFNVAIAGAAAEVISTGITVGLAQLIDPLHALASKGVTSAATSFCVCWYFSANTEFGRPIPGSKVSAIRPLLGFSGYQFGFNFINFFSRNLDNMLVARYMGAGMLGIYDKAYQLMKYPLMLLTFAMTPAIQPVIRKYAHDPLQLESIHRDFTFKLSLLGAAVGLIILVSADWIVLILLGDQWQRVIPIIRILSISIPVQVVLSTSGSFFQAMNRVDLLFLSGMLSAMVMVGAIVGGIIQRDIELMCWYLVIAFHVNFCQCYYFMYRNVFGAPLGRHLISMLPATTVVAGMVCWIQLS